MRIEQLEYLVKISKMNNMTKAANALHISQPSLSESIKRLEKELEIDLLERHHNGVVLTEAGQCVVESSKIIFKEINFMKHKLDGMKAQETMETKNFSIDVTPFIGNTYFWEFWKNCKERLNWEVNIKQYDARKILERMASGLSSTGIVLIERNVLEEVQKREAHLDFYLLQHGKLKVCFSKEHPLAGYDIIPTEELFKYPLLFPKNECIPVRRILEQYKQQINLIESDLYMLPRRFVNDHQGMSLLSTVLLRYFKGENVDLEEVVARDIEPDISSDLYLVMETNYAKTKNGLAFRKEVIKYFEKNSL